MKKDEIYILRGASHALRSYQHGNGAPALAQEFADRLDELCEKAIADLISENNRMDFTRAHGLTPEIEKEIDDAFEYHAWTDQQVTAGVAIRQSLAAAVKAIVAGAPPCPDRSAAIRKLREARMDANSAITHHGKY